MQKKLSIIFWLLVAPGLAKASTDIASMLPFAGSYQSLASTAQELTSREKNSWTTIPQNVYLNLIRDQEILELQLTIEVLDSTGQKLYPIENTMWLRHVGNNQLEVYKLSRSNDAFDKVGDGECSASACAYEYVILAQNNGNPYQQRYTSSISWSPGEAGASFTQAGSLSAKLTSVEDGEDPWLVFKTWSNKFEARP
ncbi:MAG: hypothetical protein QNJ69_00290 [Gammaproteobacteria bacterium]|nr:hypothetical protein [Gammaproteobacteria bacterium]